MVFGSIIRAITRTAPKVIKTSKQPVQQTVQKPKQVVKVIGDISNKAGEKKGLISIDLPRTTVIRESSSVAEKTGGFDPKRFLSGTVVGTTSKGRPVFAVGGGSKKVSHLPLGNDVRKSVAVSEFGGELRNFKPQFGSGQINLENSFVIRAKNPALAKKLNDNINLQVARGTVEQSTVGSVQPLIRKNDLSRIDVGGVELGRVAEIKTAKNLREFKAGDILFSNRGTIGKTRQFEADTKILPVSSEPTRARGKFGVTESFDNTALEVERSSFGFPDLDELPRVGSFQNFIRRPSELGIQDTAARGGSLIENFNDLSRVQRSSQFVGGLGQGKGRGFRSDLLESGTERDARVKKAAVEFIKGKSEGDKVTIKQLAEQFNVRTDDIRSELNLAKIRSGLDRKTTLNPETASIVATNEKIISTPVKRKRGFNIVQDLKGRDSAVAFVRGIAEGDPVTRKTLARLNNVTEETIAQKLRILRSEAGIPKGKKLTQSDAKKILEKLPDDFETSRVDLNRQRIIERGFLRSQSELGIQDTAARGGNILNPTTGSGFEEIGLGAGAAKARVQPVIARPDSDLGQFVLPFGREQNLESRAIFDSLTPIQKTKLVGQSDLTVPFGRDAEILRSTKFEPKKIRKEQTEFNKSISELDSSSIDPANIFSSNKQQIRSDIVERLKTTTDPQTRDDLLAALNRLDADFTVGPNTIFAKFDNVFNQRLTALPESGFLETAKIKPVRGLIKSEEGTAKSKTLRKLTARELDEVRQGKQFDQVRRQQREATKQDKLLTGSSEGLSGFRNVFGNSNEIFVKARPLSQRFDEVTDSRRVDFGEVSSKNPIDFIFDDGFGIITSQKTAVDDLATRGIGFADLGKIGKLPRNKNNFFDDVFDARLDPLFGEGI